MKQLTVTIEQELYDDLQHASIACGSPSVVREAIIYFLCKMGYSKVSNFDERFKYVQEIAQRSK